MTSVIGVALESTVVRIAHHARGQWRVAEYAWNPETPERLVDLLQAEVPAPRAIVLAIGLGFLETSKPDLPPLLPSDARRVLLRDADRYFPLEQTAAVSAPGAGGIAFAMSAAQLQRWVDAFASWAPVRGVFAAPDCVATALGSSGSLRGPGVGAGARVGSHGAAGASAQVNAETDIPVGADSDTDMLTYRVDAGIAETGLVRFQARDETNTDAYCVVDARRIPTGMLDAAVQHTTFVHELSVEGVTGQYAAAIGAVQLRHSSVDAMLLDANSADAFRGARNRRVLLSAVVFAVALLIVVLSFNARRDTTLRVTQRLVDSLTAVAAPGLAAQLRLQQFGTEGALLAAQASGRDDVLHVIAALSEALPRDAFVERLEWDGSQWRIDGSVNQASSVVPRLDSARLFTDVHVLGASTRFRDGAQMRESFSVSFRTTGASRGSR